MAFLDETGLATLWDCVKEKASGEVGDVLTTTRTELGDNWRYATANKYLRLTIRSLLPCYRPK